MVVKANDNKKQPKLFAANDGNGSLCCHTTSDQPRLEEGLDDDGDGDHNDDNGHGGDQHEISKGARSSTFLFPATGSPSAPDYLVTCDNDLEGDDAVGDGYDGEDLCWRGLGMCCILIISILSQV